jgi:hypothetical protein
MTTTATGTSVASLASQAQSAIASLGSLGINLNGAAGGGATTATGAVPAGAGAAPEGQKATAVATGKPQIINQGGTIKYFPAGTPGQTVQEITAFQYTDAQQFKINLDYKDGIATGLANLSRIFGARQERVRLLSNALANDANTTGSFNPVDLQKMSLETTTTQQLSEMQKKIFDSMKDSISPWLR